VPNNAVGTLKVVVTFDSGPLRGMIEARTAIEIKSK
jgi:hypothetical protein